MRVCTQCHTEKPIVEFKNPKHSWCADCARRKERERWANQPIEKRRAKWLKTKYNISYDEYNILYVTQNGKCRICNIEISITQSDNGHTTACVDHDHKSGKIRGLLCNHCNRAIGLLKDNINYGENLVKYLKDNLWEEHT